MLTSTKLSTETNKTMELEDKYCAQYYAPLPVVLVKGKGIYVWDEDENRYIDMMSAYSAISHGHCHPRLVKKLTEQACRLAVVSRAFYTDQLGSFLQKACKLTGMDKAMPLNSGSEAVEAAIKSARKWAYTQKGVTKDQAEIIVCSGNFHGRTTTIVSFSSEKQYKTDFGPLTPGFLEIPFNDASALENAITANTAAFLVEPIQGESGIHLPSDDYLAKCAQICKRNNVLLICDEIQSGLGRTGKLLACEHYNVKPDGLILGKALGGGLLPVSLFLAREDVINVFTPGDHGSTFGGNALSSAVGHEALDVLIEEKLIENSAKMGEYFIEKLKKIESPLIQDIRGKGLFIGIEIDPNKASARDVCLKLMEKGLLSKETHHTVIRLAPPLVITEKQINDAVAIIRDTLENWRG